MNKSHHKPVTPTNGIFEASVNGRHLTFSLPDGVPVAIKTVGGIGVDHNVVVDGNSVTSRWPLVLQAYKGEIIKRVSTDLK